MSEPEIGTVKAFNQERGFGFIRPDGQTLPEVFFHVTALDGAYVERGDRVAYSRVEAPDGRWRAHHVRALPITPDNIFSHG